MSKGYIRRIFIIIFLLMVGIVGCNNASNINDTVAYISSNLESSYEKTFKELNLGTIFDFNYKLPKADKSWVEMWVEGYSDGNKVDPFPLMGLSYGLSPNQIEEGNMGFGII